MDPRIFFDGWESLLRTVIAVAVAYPAMLLMVRLSGHRTLVQMNAFDFIVAIALGSILANVITTPDVPLAPGLLAFALLIGFQVVLSWATTRSEKFERVVNGRPVVLVRGGEYLQDAMRSERITEDEVDAAVRQQGIDGLDGVEKVTLETDGSMSVLARDDKHEQQAEDRRRSA